MFQASPHSQHLLKCMCVEEHAYDHTQEPKPPHGTGHVADDMAKRCESKGVHPPPIQQCGLQVCVADGRSVTFTRGLRERGAVGPQCKAEAGPPGAEARLVLRKVR